jgi:hypothetical protein
VTPHRHEPVEPEDILPDLLRLDPDLRRVRYWGEDSIFYNPHGVAALGIIFASIKDQDGANDRSAMLSRPGIYRFAFQLAADEYVRRFGKRPARPAKGGIVELPDYDPSRVNELMPHPVYAWMAWVQILAPAREQFDSLRPLLANSLEAVRAKWRTRKGN